MRDHFKALVATMLAVQAASVATALADSGAGLAPVSIDRVVLVDGLDSQSSPLRLIDSSNDIGSAPLAFRSHNGTSDVMNLPAEPIPAPPAFAMGLTVMAGVAGYNVVRRLRAA